MTKEIKKRKRKKREKKKKAKTMTIDGFIGRPAPLQYALPDASQAGASLSLTSLAFSICAS